ncbi:MAG TPA: hypothetical protein VK974_11205 [Methylophilaceae bacterium]|nr:hypothetical protein [Methylophilaceae bacterium]
MHQISNRILAGVISSIVLLPISSIAAEAPTSESLNPSPGQWTTVVAILDSSNNHYLLKTSVKNTPEQCMTALQDTATHVQAAGGVIWTDPQKNVISYEKKAGYAERGSKVLELRCVLEPFEAELVKK